MKFYYISPSTIPSKSANSVHVIMQCDALIKAGNDVTLVANRTLPDNDMLLPAIYSSYGVDLKSARIITFFSSFNMAVNIRIAILTLWELFRKTWPDVILSRNLYASYMIGVVLRRPILFETHQLETGIRKFMQRAIMTRQRIKTVVISKKLEEYLTQHHGLGPANTLVLHDAAPDGIEPLPKDQKHNVLTQICPQSEGNWRSVCGYFGHLYAGRGVEIIESMAKARPDVLFLLFGGSDVDVQTRKQNNNFRNLHYVGHVPHPVAQQAMRSVDILLMPYQKSVSIGVSGHDTARWMSPMKMFEYMATGVPIISSDLPVLREVLKDGENALLVPPDDSRCWVTALDRLFSDKVLAMKIGECAHENYKVEHTWARRAQKIIVAGKELQE